MVNVIFIFNKEQININCNNDEDIGNVYRIFSRKVGIRINDMIYLYRGNIIDPQINLNKQIKFEDLEKKKVIILSICKKNKNIKDNIYKENSTNILCPECGESCKIKFDNFKILLYDCENSHKIDNIKFEHYNELQKKC